MTITNLYDARRIGSLLAVAALAAATIAGCGGSGGGSTRSSQTQATRAPTKVNVKFTGKPIVVATEAPVSNASLGVEPQIFSAVKAAARAINDAGGIKGHEVKVVTCDTQSNPNMELSCARSAIAAHAVAEVGSFVVANSAGYEATLDHAGVPDLAANAGIPSEYQTSNVYPIDFGPGELAACANKSLVKRFPGNNLTVTAESQSAVTNEYEVLKGAAAGQGISTVSPVLIASTTADFSPTIQRLQDAKVAVDVMADGAPVQEGLLSAANSVGAHLGFCSINLLPASDLAKLGSEATSYYGGQTLPPISAASKYPLMEKFITQMKSEQAAGDSTADVSSLQYNPYSLVAWLGMQVLDQVVSKMSGSITAHTLSSALDTSTVHLGNLIPTIDFGKPQTVGPYKRVFNPIVYLQRWDATSSKFVLDSGDKVNAATLLSAK